MDINYNKIIKIYEKTLIIENYKNVHKLTTLLSFWLKLYNYSLKKNISIPDNCLNIFEEILRKEGTLIKEKAFPKKSLKKKILFFLSSKLPLNKGILQYGLLSKSQKLRALITIAKIDSIRLDLNENLIDQFNHAFSGNYKYQLIINKIPPIFFSRIVNKSFFPNVIDTIPISFFKTTYFKTLFIDKKLIINGFQHGGGYGEFLNNKLDLFDSKISDNYYYWGLGPYNKLQRRFLQRPILLNKIKSLCLVGTQDCSGIFSFLIDFHESNFSNAIDNRLRLFNKITSKNIEILYLQNPKQKDNNISLYPTLHLTNMSRDDKLNTLFIFDYPMHTFFYEAIYSSFPFILFFDRSWEKSFTKSYNDLLKIFRDNNILYYWDELEKFIKRLNFLKNNEYPFQLLSSSRKYLTKNISL